jgi:hypothetical protein
MSMSDPGRQTVWKFAGARDLRELERAARRESLERHGIILRFARTTKGAP